MIEVHELLRTKENELSRVRREIEALRTVAPLLAEPEELTDSQPSSETAASPVPVDASSVHESDLEDASSPESNEAAVQPISPKRSRVRDWLGRAVGE
jgi:hypothetical protein